MGIREEIEKLKVGFSKLTSPYPQSHLEHLQTHNEAIDAVLSILDEWECVREGPLEYVLGQDYSGHRIGEDWVHSLLIGIKNGSHISIYVRRKKNK